jgi:hypothetical protein
VSAAGELLAAHWTAISERPHHRLLDFLIGGRSLVYVPKHVDSWEDCQHFPMPGDCCRDSL